MTREGATTELRNILRVEQNRIHKDFVLIGALKMAVKALEEQRTGHWWINPDGYAPYCSECKHDSDRASAYCPTCGAKMEEVK